MKKYSLHLLTVIFLAIGIASCKKGTAIPEDNTAEAKNFNFFVIPNEVRNDKSSSV